MRTLRHLGAYTSMVLLTILLVACGGTTTQSSAATTNQGAKSTNNGYTTTKQNTNAGTPATNTMPAANATATMTGSMDGMNQMQGIAITPDMGGTMAALIHTGIAKINGTAINVLMTQKGFAIYYYTPDTAFKATCVAACAQDWPAVLASQGMMTVSSSVTLPKLLSVHQTANGAQVFYDGHALYTYAADKQANSALGHGQDMQWYLVNYMQSNMTTIANNPMQGVTIVPGMAGTMMGTFIHTGVAAINTHQVSVLMTQNNFALYYYRADTAFKATCTGDCAKDWPPLLAPQGMMTVSSSVTLPKMLSVHQTANGAQVFYDGHALYTYAEDKQAGTALGRGQDMQWYLVGFLL